jgi:hypothetical protein
MARAPRTRSSTAVVDDYTRADVYADFDHLPKIEVALSRLDSLVISATQDSCIEYVFADVTEIHESDSETEQAIRDALKGLEQREVAYCPQDRTSSSNVVFLPSMQSALELQKESRNVFYFGAAKFASLGRSEDRAQKFISEIIQNLSDRRGNRGSRLIFTYTQKTKSEICRIYDFVYNNLHNISNCGLATHITHLKILGFSNITSDVKKNCLDDFTIIAERYAQTVAEATFDTLLLKLEDHERSALIAMRDQQIQKIKPSLVKGIVHGGNRANDRPWGFDKIVEEIRQEVLAALIRETAPTYNSGQGISAENFIGQHITPHVHRFSLPQNVLRRISPAAFSAKYRK